MATTSVSDALIVGTRGSALAVAQSRATADLLARALGRAVELVTVTTHGDTSRASLSSLGGTGVFASALRESLLAGECDIVVHSLKDLPTTGYAGLTIGAVPEREDARDALCARDGLTLETLPHGARVGTGSPRRVAQLLARRPDLDVRDIRGNVDTRLRFVADGELDAVVLAAAGLARLGRSAAVTEFLEHDTAPGQGALAIERRLDESRDDVLAALDAVDVRDARLAVDAERGVLAGLEAGCAAPIAARATVDGGTVRLTATVYRHDGSETLTTATEGAAGTSDAADAAVRELLDRGAARLAPIGRDA